MLTLAPKLRDRTDPIRVGVIGAGIFGSQVIHAVEATAGMETAAIADIDLDKAKTAFGRTGVEDSQVEVVETADDLTAAVDADKRTMTRNGDAVVGAEIDVVLEATGNPNIAAQHAFKTLLNGTHFVNVSVEADTVCGPLLARLAECNGVTYSLAYGDQPAKIVELTRWAETAGFEVIAAGRTSSPPQRYGTPADSIERHPHIASFGDGLDPEPYIYNTFIDGTKTAVESVAAANALGLGIDTTDMHQPSVRVADIPDTLKHESAGGILGRPGVIDTVISEDADFTVFVVTRTESEQLQEYYSQRPNITTSEDDQYQLFSKPFHFASETTVSIASAALLNEPTGAPVGHTAEVVAGARKDLEPGEEIDGGGGYTIYGVAADADRAAAEGYVPFELLEGAEVLRPVDRDEILRADDVDVRTDQPLYHLRQLQETL